MSFPRSALQVSAVVLAVFVGLMISRSTAQNPGPTQRTSIDTLRNKQEDPSQIIQGHYELQVIESFDALYHGDQPGHVCRHGGLDNDIPKAAVGDPVFRGEKKVGVISQLKWSQARGSLEVEFDPDANVRVAVGDIVWIKLGDPAESASPQK